MRKGITGIIVLSCLLTISGIGIMTATPANAYQSTWGVAPGKEIDLQVSVDFTATVPSGISTLISTYMPGYSISSMLGLVTQTYDFKLTVLSINDASTVYPVPVSTGEVVNVSVTGKLHANTAYVPAGSVIADYMGKWMDVYNTVQQVLGGPVMFTAEQKTWILGNITAMDFSNIPITCWVTPAGQSLSVPSDFPLTTLPYMMNPSYILSMLFIIPTTVNLQTLYNYAGSYWSTYMPSYFGTLDQNLNAYGSYMKFTQREMRMGWSLAGYEQYLKNTMGYDPIAYYSTNSKFDFGAYIGYDTYGVLSATCVYMDASGTLNMDFTAYGGPNFSGDIVFSAAIIINQPGAYVPTKGELYVSGIPGFPVVLLGLAAAGSVTVILIRIKRHH